MQSSFKLATMSEKSLKWYQKYVQIVVQELQESSLKLSPEMLKRKNFALEMLSAFAFAMMILWMELFCIVLFGLLTVSFVKYL